MSQVRRGHSNQRDDEKARSEFFAGEAHLSEVRGLLEHNVQEAAAAETIEYEEYEEEKDHPVLRFFRALATALFILGFVGACLFETYTLRQEEMTLQAACDEIEGQITAEKARVIEYKVDKAYYNSDEYKEGMARNRFRLIYNGEVLIQVTEK